MCFNVCFLSICFMGMVVGSAHQAPLNHCRGREWSQQEDVINRA